jgi:hypothetical protein
MDIERRLYHYGLGAGVPYGALNSIANIFDEARNAKELSRRRRLAQSIIGDSRWRDFVPKDRGFALVGPETLPHTQEAIKASRSIIEDRRKTQGWKARRNNPFYQCERPEDIVNYPELMKFALSDTMLQIVSGYYGLVPQIKEIGIWLTPPQEHQFSSQLYHLDKPESQLLKLFINIDPTQDDAGPLTLLPANVSRKVRQKTRYEAIYFRGNGRLTDQTVFSICSQSDQIMLGGASGTGGFADTSNCFHFGSRCKSGERKMLTVAFMLPHKTRDPRTPLFDLVPLQDDEVRRLVLSGSAHNGA